MRSRNRSYRGWLPSASFVGRAVDHQTGLDQSAVAVIFESVGEGLPAAGGISKAEVARDLAAQPPSLEIRNGALRAAQLLPIVISRGAQDFGQRGAVRGIRCALLEPDPVIFLRNRKPDRLRQIGHRFRKRKPRIFHQKADGSPVFAAAEAMVELLGWADGKRR